MASAQVRAVGAALTARVQRAQGALATAVHGELVSPPPRGTPVDTGWARANWRVTSTPPTGSFPRKGSLRLTADVAEARVAVLSQSQTLWVWNPVPYINRLNRGWSAQSPPGFVQAAIDRGIALARRQLRNQPRDARGRFRRA